MLERGLWTMVAKAPGKSPSISERLTISETEADAWTRDDRCQARGYCERNTVYKKCNA
jgi:hypothetical protein